MRSTVLRREPCEMVTGRAMPASLAAEEAAVLAGQMSFLLAAAQAVDGIRWPGNLETARAWGGDG